MALDREPLRRKLFRMHTDPKALVVKAWNIPAPVHCAPLHEMDHVFLLDMPDGARFVLKEIEIPSRVTAMEMEYKVLAYLHSQGVPVARPLLTRDNSCYAVHDGRLYSLAPYLPSGETADARALFRNMGAAIGKLHRALAAYPEKIDSWHITLSPRIFNEAAGVLRKHLSEEERRPLLTVLSTVEEEMKRAWSGLPEQHIHGDCHGGNIVVYAGQVTGFIDCDHLPLGPRIYDLAYLLADRIKNALADGREASCLEMFHPLLDGYEGISPLTQAEKHAVGPVALGVQVIFTGHFAQRAKRELVQKNANAFFWIHKHKEEIMRACCAG